MKEKSIKPINSFQLIIEVLYGDNIFIRVKMEKFLRLPRMAGISLRHSKTQLNS